MFSETFARVAKGQDVTLEKEWTNTKILYVLTAFVPLWIICYIYTEIYFSNINNWLKVKISGLIFWAALNNFIFGNKNNVESKFNPLIFWIIYKNWVSYVS